MLKVYKYTEDEIGIGKWAQGPLRLEPSQEVSDPGEADVLVVPPALYTIPRESVKTLKYLYRGEDRHALFHCSDHDATYGMKCLFIQCNLKAKMLAVDTNSISWSWPVNDLGSIAHVPDDGFRYDVSFHGWMSSEARRKSIGSCGREQLKCDWALYPDFYGYVERDNPKEGVRRRNEFLRSVHESRIVLAPRSIDGVFPYRFWEGMSAARVTVMVGSNYNLPWKSKIDWDRCVIQVPESEAGRAGEVIRNFLSTHTDEQIVEMGKYGREMWLRWMSPDRWPQLMAEAVEEKLKSLGKL